MRPRNPPIDLLDVAAAVGDGAVVDWTRIEAQATPADRHLAADLHLLELIAMLHAGLPPVAAFERSLHDSLFYRTGTTGESASEPPAKWGPLTIVDKIGSGTYADVYRARDPRLDRPVALKLLRHRDAADAVIESEAIEEARLLARIRHPNVVAVYGAERIDGRAGIWMELVDGQTLEQELRERGPFSAEELVAVGTAICGALHAVHQAGLLHRDVKAQNVMRDRDGRVLLTDFGTGREVAQMEVARELAGTPLYLAPEVLNRGAATVASDVYSLGVLLHHLATGSFPVSGRSLRDLSDAHARAAHVSLRETRADLPNRLSSTIDRATAIDTTLRIGSALDFETALNTARSPRMSQRRTRLVGIALAVTLLLAATAYFGPFRLVGSPALSMKFMPEFVTSSGDASLGVVSPSGRFVAYVRGGQTQTLWVHSLAEHADFVDRQLVGPEEGRLFLSLSIDHNDEYVDFLVTEGTPRSENVWRIPFSGGPARKIVDHAASGVGWSPDDRHIAFLQGPVPRAELMIADSDGTNERALMRRSIPGGFLPLREVDRGFPRPAWSPDGKTIALLAMTKNVIVLVDSKTGQMVRQLVVGADSTVLLGLAWLDASTLLVNRHDVILASSAVWTVNAVTGQSTLLTNDVSDFTDVTATTDGRTAAATRTDWRTSVWIGGPSGESMTMTAALPGATGGSIRWLSLDDQGDLAISNQLGDRRSLLIARRLEGPFQQIATRGHLPTLAPDGHAIVFVDDGTNQGLYRADIDGSQVTQLVKGIVFAPSISWDSQTVFFLLDKSGMQSIWSVPMAGGPAHEVIHRPFGRTPLVSPDDRQLFLTGEDGVFVCDLPACVSPRQLHLPLLERISGAPWQMAPDGKGIGMVLRDSPANVWLQPLDGGSPRQLTNFADLKVTSFGWSSDGKHLVLARANNPSDIVLFKRLRGR